MTQQEVKKKDYPKHISASQISQFLHCPLSWKMIYTGETQRLPANLYILHGQAIHFVLETNYQQKISSRVDIPVDVAVKLFLDNFEEIAEKELGYSFSPDVFRTLCYQGELMVRKYWAEVAPTLMPIAVEQKFEIQLESMPDVIIYGFIDLISDEGEVIDHKNAGESTAKNWSQNYVDDMHQLTMYALAYHKMYKTPPKNVRIDVLKRLKKGPEIQTIRSTRSAVQILAIAQLMQRMKQMQQLNLYYASLNNCRGCDFEATCDRLSLS